MIRKILLAVAAVLLVFFAYVGLQPSDYMISREIAIKAPADKIFPYLNNSKLSGQWAPWQEVDPEARMNYSGPDSGVGSRTEWDGKGQLGTGSATIVESVPNQKVGIKLEYVKPMSMTQDAEYLVRTAGAESIVTWKVQGKNNFVGRMMCVFMNMDKMVGGMFEKGLANLKNLAEKPN